MRDFNKVVKELKLYLANNSKKKVLDKDIADALEISQSNFATIKRRNSMPYENILKYCLKEGICCSKLFFEK